MPASLTLGGRALSAITASQSDFMQLTKIPIVIYYGDNIPDTTVTTSLTNRVRIPARNSGEFFSKWPRSGGMS